MQKAISLRLTDANEHISPVAVHHGKSNAVTKDAEKNV